jgi:hypothetical protein
LPSPASGVISPSFQPEVGEDLLAGVLQVAEQAAPAHRVPDIVVRVGRRQRGAGVAECRCGHGSTVAARASFRYVA